MSQELMDEEFVYVDDEALNADESEFSADNDSELVSFDDIDFEALGINPGDPTQAKPGSEEKVLMLSARYAAGLPLWHNHDRYDHAPGQSAVSGFGGLKFDA